MLTNYEQEEYYCDACPQNCRRDHVVGDIPYPKCEFAEWGIRTKKKEFQSNSICDYCVNILPYGRCKISAMCDDYEGFEGKELYKKAYVKSEV